MNFANIIQLVSGGTRIQIQFGLTEAHALPFILYKFWMPGSQSNKGACVALGSFFGGCDAGYRL